MDINATRALADAILATTEKREASWDGGRYTLTWSEAAEQAGVDQDLQPLIAAMLGSGCADFPQWAEAHATR
jgi:hypothetical protein